MLICKNSLYCRCVMHPSGSLDYRNKINSMTSLLELSVSEIIILLIIQRCSILKQTIWHSNHTSHTKLYFNEFVANVLRDNIGILIFDLHGGCQRPHTIQRPLTLALWDGPNIELKCQSERSLYGVWHLTASMEVKISMPMLSLKTFATN